MSSRVGLIGGGRWGAVHRNALRRSGATLAAVLVATRASAARLAQEWRVPVFTELEEFLAADMDAVIVASPNHLHAPQALAVLQSGRHVLVEKPMALSSAECEAMIAQAADSGKVLAVGHEMRFFTLFGAVRHTITTGLIGRPLHLKLDLWRRPYRSGASGWKRDPARLGSTILEEPIHYLDLARWYLGECVELQAWANSRAGAQQSWENLDIRLEHDGGARSWVTRTIAAFGHQVTLMLVGEEGSLRASWRGTMDMDTQPAVSLVRQRGQEVENLPVTRETGHAFDVPRQTAAFLGAVRANGPAGESTSGSEAGAAPAAGPGGEQGGLAVNHADAAAGPAPRDTLARGRDGLAAVEMCLAAQRSLEGGGRTLRL